MTARRDLRRRIRRLRRELTPKQRRESAWRLRRIVIRSPAWRHARHVACYLPADGEIDVRPLIETGWRTRRHIYLPVLESLPTGHMCFRRYSPGQLLRKNRFGIPEPRGAGTEIRLARRLDLVLCPLVAFDAMGHRLGMGGGYYDRRFAFLRGQRHWRRPRLLGVGFAFQRVASLPAEPWDVPLWGVATDAGLRIFPDLS